MAETPPVNTARRREIPRARKLVYGIVMATLVLVLLEIGSRLVLSVWGVPEYFLQDLQDTEVHEPDPVLFWKNRRGLKRHIGNLGRPFDWVINAQGFRADEPILRQPEAGVKRIICLGDSVTFGYRVQRKEAYPHQLEKILCQRGRYQVINAGVVGYSSYQARRYLESELFDYRPDIIITYLGINDSNPASREDHQRSVGSPGIQLVGGLGLFRLLRRLRGTPLPDQFTKRRVYLNDYLANMRAIARGSQARGVQLVMVLPLVLSSGRLNYAFPDTREGVSDQALREEYWEFARRHVSVELLSSVSPQASVAHRTLFVEEPPYYCHWNATGHRLVAVALAEKLGHAGVLSDD